MDCVYDAIGGLAGLEFAIEGVCDRVRADREMAPLFRSLDMPRLKSRLMAQLADATGGPVPWTPAAVLLDEPEVQAVLRHLAPALEDIGIDRELAEAISERVWPAGSTVAA
jgi:truncated hemoglobin YjbI